MPSKLTSSASNDGRFGQPPPPAGGGAPAVEEGVKNAGSAPICLRGGSWRASLPAGGGRKQTPR